MQQAIVRTGTTARWSDTVTYGKTAYLCEVPSNEQDDMAAQTRSLLQVINARLKEIGSDKNSILNASIYITDRDHVAVFNALWDDWLPAGTAPVRACIIADLVNPALLVEVQLIVAVH